LVPKLITLNSVTAATLSYSTAFGSFGDQLRESGNTHTVRNKNVVQRI